MDTPVSTQPAAIEPLLVLLQLEASARRVQEIDALYFYIVNETRRLINYRQAVIFIADDNTRNTMRAKAISSIAVVDKDAPMVQWLEQNLNTWQRANPELMLAALDATMVDAESAEAWADFSLPYVAWAAMKTPAGKVMGGIWLARELPWQDNELTLLERLAETYAHALQALPKTITRHVWRKPIVRYGLIGLLLVALIPVRLSTLAPAEIVPDEPIMVSAGIDGVIADIVIEPNSYVQPGQVLIRFEDTVLRNDYEVADKTLSVAETEHLRAMQASFIDPKVKADVALLKAKVDLAKAERDYARDMLARVEIKADRAGVALFNDALEWEGKPVKTGETIMELADPKHMALRINLPVKDAIPLDTDADALVFFDADPLHAMSAKITQTTYQAEVMSGDLLAYRIQAKFSHEPSDTMRIGWQGTAKLYGQKAPLVYYLFRRPIAFLRQYLGI